LVLIPVLQRIENRVKDQAGHPSSQATKKARNNRPLPILKVKMGKKQHEQKTWNKKEDCGHRRPGQTPKPQTKIRG
jgi:hypothetical protein